MRFAREKKRRFHDVRAIVGDQKAELRLVLGHFGLQRAADLVADALTCVAGCVVRHVHEVEQYAAHHQVGIEEVRGDGDETARHAVGPAVKRERDLRCCVGDTLANGLLRCIEHLERASRQSTARWNDDGALRQMQQQLLHVAVLDPAKGQRSTNRSSC